MPIGEPLILGTVDGKEITLIVEGEQKKREWE